MCLLAGNTDHFMIQELNSIGLKFIERQEKDGFTRYMFEHRGMPVHFDLYARGNLITKITNTTINDTTIGLEYDAGRLSNIQIEAIFADSFDKYISLLNKEIMKLDGIGV